MRCKFVKERAHSPVPAQLLAWFGDRHSFSFGKSTKFSSLSCSFLVVRTPKIPVMRNMHLPIVVCTLAQLCSSACIPFDQARHHIGETQCVTGKIVRVEAGAKGVHYLDFCEDYRLCSFSVVVFSYDLRNVGDVRELASKVVEIHGEVKEYDDRAEIILESRKRLGGEGASLPPMPKNFAVEQHGNFSPGQFRAPPNRTIRKKKGHSLRTSR